MSCDLCMIHLYILLYKRMEIVNVYQYKKYRNDKMTQGLGDFIRGCF